MKVYIHYSTTLNSAEDQTTITLDNHKNFHWLCYQLEAQCFPISLIYKEKQIEQIIIIQEQGDYVIFDFQLLQIQPLDKPILLVTDLDHTLVAHLEDQKHLLKNFIEYWLQKHYFNGSKLIYNTGRSLDEFIDLTNEHYLLEPDLICTAVGSDMYKINSEGSFELVEEYYSSFNHPEWNAQQIANSFDSNFPWAIKEGIGLNQFRFRILRKAEITIINQHRPQLQEFIQGLEHPTRIVINGRGEYRWIDILPVDGGKYKAVKYAQQVFGIKSEDTAIAGDSCNDSDMYFGDELSVVVNNATPDLVAYLQSTGAKNYYLSCEPYSAAIIEVCERIQRLASQLFLKFAYFIKWTTNLYPQTRAPTTSYSQMNLQNQHSILPISPAPFHFKTSYLQKKVDFKSVQEKCLQDGNEGISF